MKLERKVYESRSQKTGDFFIGVILMIAWDIGDMAFFAKILGNSPSSQTSQLLWFLSVPLLFAVAIVALIYFGLTRYWIALGIASVLLVILCVTFSGPIVGRFLFPNGL